MADQTNPAIVPIIARVLPAEEWGRLSQPELQALDPEHSIVVVVEEGGPGGRILAEWGAMTAVHVEGLRIVEGGVGVARALLRCMSEALINTGVQEVLTQVADPAIAQLAHEAGGSRVAGETWVIPIRSIDPD